VTIQYWQVIEIDDTTHLCDTSPGTRAWLVGDPGDYVVSDDTAREAVCMLAAHRRWAVSEIVAPGAQPLTKRLAAARAVARHLLSVELTRCQKGYDEETGEYDEGGCEAVAVVEIVGPHEERGGFFCREHGTAIHAEIVYNHRWHLADIPGVEKTMEAQRLARVVLKEESL
jgi:hypothetical protein